MAAMRARPRPKRAKLEGAPTYRRGPRKTLSRESWITAALRLLEKSGIGSVKIDLLARQLRVTRGSFYFHFSGLGDLQEALLKEWRRRNCLPFEALGAETGLNGLALFERTVGIWVDEAPFRPLLDLAVRDWSRNARKLAHEVEGADGLRVALLERAFRAIGYPDEESLVRARITYFHQIGYYALSFKENDADRRRYRPIYGRVLLGSLGAVPASTSLLPASKSGVTCMSTNSRHMSRAR
jgi:AcrR family transcriptional regulator